MYWDFEMFPQLIFQTIIWTIYSHVKVQKVKTHDGNPVLCYQLIIEHINLFIYLFFSFLQQV